MKLLIVVAIILAVAHANSEEQWKEYKAKYGRTYKSLHDEKRRFAIFQDNLRQIEEHNRKFVAGEVSFTKGINQFADMSQEEFRATLTSLDDFPIDVQHKIFNKTGIVADQEINWVTKGYVTPVRNQGYCGSCWAFSCAAAVEGQVVRNGGDLVPLSPKNLLDCVVEGNLGCLRGGDRQKAFKYIQENGILPEEKYPYKAQKDECTAKGGPKSKNLVIIPRKDEDALMKALYTVGPISVGVNADTIDFYSGGVIDSKNRCIRNTNHAVLLVGAGSENGKDYWLIKNSWGVGWGEKGYFKVERGSNTLCIGLRNMYPEL